MEVEVLELKKMLKNKEVVLVDVREPYEIEICNVKGSLFIPMNEIPQNIEGLDKEKRYAVMCHSGVRSLYVSNYLNSLGYSTLNVIGGIDRWATDVDKKMKRY